MEPDKKTADSRLVNALRSGVTIVALTLLLLLVIEVGSYLVLRSQDLHAWRPGPDWEEYSPVYGWRMRPSFDGMVGQAPRTSGVDGLPTWCDPSRPGKRVLVLGDSTAYGYGVSDGESYAALLQDAHPELNVINLATPGYTSYQGLQRLLSEGDALDPDLIIAAFGFNDRRIVIAKADEDNPEKFSRYYRGARLQRLARWSNALALMQHIASKGSGLDIHTPDLVRGLNRDFDDLTARVPPAKFSENIESIVAWGRERDVRTILVLNGDHPDTSALFDEGDHALTNGQYEEAFLAFLAGAKAHPFFQPLAEARAAMALEALGLYDEAESRRNVYELRLPFHGGALRYRDRGYQEILRNVARKSGALLLDTTQVLADHEDTYLDFCHWTPLGHALIAEALAEELSRLLDLQSAPKVALDHQM